jgi:CheY-like chemotaxis protein
MKVTCQKKNFLVVDDEEDIREILCDFLKRFDATVMEATNGVEAYEIAKSSSMDIIFSDIRMPGGSGIELLERVRAVNATRPLVVLMTGHSEYSQAEMLKRGANAVISKPFKLDVIKEIIEDYDKKISA